MFVVFIRTYFGLPCKNGCPKISLLPVLGHPVSKSWLSPCPHVHDFSKVVGQVETSFLLAYIKDSNLPKNSNINLSNITSQSQNACQSLVVLRKSVTSNVDV